MTQNCSTFIVLVYLPVYLKKKIRRKKNPLSFIYVDTLHLLVSTYIKRNVRAEVLFFKIFPDVHPHKLPSPFFFLKSGKFKYEKREEEKE